MFSLPAAAGSAAAKTQPSSSTLSTNTRTNTGKSASSVLTVNMNHTHNACPSSVLLPLSDASKIVENGPKLLAKDIGDLVADSSPSESSSSEGNDPLDQDTAAAMNSGILYL